MARFHSYAVVLGAVPVLLAFGAGCGGDVNVEDGGGSAADGGGSGKCDSSTLRGGDACSSEGQTCKHIAKCAPDLKCVDGTWRQTGIDCGVECPDLPSDDDIFGLLHQVCDGSDSVCNSFGSHNGCGGCSVTCTNSEWTAGLGHGDVCQSAPPGC